MICPVCGYAAPKFKRNICPQCGIPVNKNNSAASDTFPLPLEEVLAPESSPASSREPHRKKTILLPGVLAVIFLVFGAWFLFSRLAAPGAEPDTGPQPLFSSRDGLSVSFPALQEPGHAISEQTLPSADETTAVSEDVPDETPASSPEVIVLPDGAEAPQQDFIFPFSSTQPLTYAMLDDVFSHLDSTSQKENCQLAINEIYARYGYPFHPEKSSTAQQAYDYFNSLPWYQQVSSGKTWSNTGEVPINSTESSNIELMVRWQKDHGLR